METLVVLDPDTEKPRGNKVKGEKAVKASMMGVGAGGRKKLTDITNLPRNHDNKQLSVSVDSKEYISKLQQENLALVKLLAERNKIIELSGIELQKQRMSIQKLQQQNKQLAQANSQMLGELNSAKDRLRIIQHELGCTKASLVGIKLMSQEKEVEVICKNQENGVETTMCDKLVGKMENNKPMEKRKSKVQSLDSVAFNQVQAQEKIHKKRSSSRRQSARFRSADQELSEDLLETSNSLEPSTGNTEQDQEKDENKRFSSRRQSARLNSQQLVKEPVEEFHTNDPKLSVSSGDDILCESCPPLISPLKSEPEAPIIETDFEDGESRRSSIRPKRRAVEKIQSYRELSLNTKMRRSE